MSFFNRKVKHKPPNFNKKTAAGTKNTYVNDKAASKKRKSHIDDEILSDSDDDDNENVKKAEFGDEFSSDEEESVQEKRLRLAKEYLSKLEEEEIAKADDGDIDRDLIANRLRRDVLEQAGKLHKPVASQYLNPTAEDIHLLRGHKLPVTCTVISSDGKYAFSGSKDGSVIKWDVKLLKKLKTIPGCKLKSDPNNPSHSGHVLCLALSSDGKFLASGDEKKLIFIWNAETCEKLHVFKGHRDAISGLTFRKNSHELFSCSHDRTVKVWNVDEMGYIETLFGHQDSITGIDSLLRERAITSGGRDGSVRIWKIVEESQLVFHGGSSSIDCVSLIDEEHFVTGADDNSISVWHVMKKKPLVTVSCAHGKLSTSNHTNENLTNGGSEVSSKEQWISSVCALQFSDLIATGSKDGLIRLWKCSENFKCLTELFTIKAAGFVNSLAFSSDGTTLVAGLGQEHRLGRWWRLREAKNGVLIVKFTKQTLDVRQNSHSVSVDNLLPR